MKMTILSAVFGLLIGGALFAQGWVRTGGGSGNDDGASVAVDKDGNVLVVGSFRELANIGGVMVQSQGGYDAFVAKYTPAGQTQWVRTGGGTGADEGRCVAVDSNGNVFITGFFQLTAIFGSSPITSHGGYDIFTAKYSPTGTLPAGGESNDHGYGIATDDVGNCYVTGGFRDFCEFDTTHIWASDGLDIFVQKFDGAGNQLWVERAGGCWDEHGNRIFVGENNHLWISAYFYGRTAAGSTVIGTAGDRDALFLHMTSDGTLEGFKHLGGPGVDSGQDAWIDAEGQMYIAGAFSNTVNFGNTVSLTSLGGQDFYVAKYGPDGGAIWARRGGGTADDYGWAVAVTPLGDVFHSGPFQSIGVFGDTVLISSGDFDVAVVKYDASGDFQWARKMGGVGYDYNYDLTTDLLGNVYVVGHFDGTATFDDTTIFGAGGWDFFVAKVAGGGEIGIDNHTPTEFELAQNYPNPFNPSTALRYAIPKNSKVSLKVYNELGQLVRTLVEQNQSAGHHEIVWDGTSDLGANVSSGIYIVRLENSGASTSRKIMLLK